MPISEFIVIAPQFLIMPRIADLANSFASNYSQPPLPPQNSLLNENRNIPDQPRPKKIGQSRRTEKLSKPSKNIPTKAAKNAPVNKEKSKPVNISKSPPKNELLEQIFPQIKNHLNFMVRLIDRAKRLEEGKRRTKQTKTKVIAKQEKKNEKSVRGKNSEKSSESEKASESFNQNSFEDDNIVQFSSEISEKKGKTKFSDIDHSVGSIEEEDFSDIINDPEDQEVSNSESSVAIRSKKGKNSGVLSKPPQAKKGR